MLRRALACSALVVGLLPAVAAPGVTAAAPHGAAPHATAPSASGTFVGVPATRLADTAAGVGVPRAPIAAEAGLAVPVAGHAGVPGTGVSAVALTVSVSAPAASGTLRAYGYRATRPTDAVLGFTAHQPASNSAIVALGSGGRIALFNASARGLDVTVAVTGYYVAGTATDAGTYRALPMTRVADTRSGVGVARGVLGARATKVVRVAGGVPAGASAVALDVVGFDASGAGALGVAEDGPAQGSAVSLRYAPARSVHALVLARLASDGTVAVRNFSAATLDVVVAVEGYFTAGTAFASGAYVPRLPSRPGYAAHTVAAHATVSVQVSDGLTLPSAGMSSVQTTLSVVSPKAAGALVAYPAGAARPAGVALRFSTATASAPVSVPVSGGRISLYNGSSSAITVDVDVQGIWGDGTLGAISGTVTDSAGHGLASVWADLGGDDGEPQSAVSAVTDPSGHFVIDGVAAGAQSVCFRAPSATGGTSTTGYIDRCYADRDWDGGVLDPVDVTAGTTTDITQALAPAFGVAGTVTDSTGHPITDAVVELDMDSGHDRGDPLVQTRTAGNGTFMLRHVQDPDFEVYAYPDARTSGGTSKTGYEANYVSVDGDTPGADNVYRDITVPLASPALLEGTVTDASGKPLAHVAVTASQGAQPDLPYVYTDAHGHYEAITDPSRAGTTVYLCFFGSTPDSAPASGGTSTTGYGSVCYHDKAYFPNDPSNPAPTPVTVQAGAITMGLDQVLPAAGAIAGRVVTPAGKPVAGVQVTVQRTFPSVADQIATATTSSAGTYRINGIQAGTYSVCFGGYGNTGYLPQCAGDTLPGDGDNVPVAAGHVATVDAHLNTGGSVTGRVTDPNGQGVPGVSVSTDYSSTTTGEGGSYTLTRVPPGARRVCFYADSLTGPGYVDQCYKNAPITSDGTPVPVGVSHTTTGIDAILTAKGTIAGTVRDSGGVAVGGVSVSFAATDGSNESVATTTDAAGRYSSPDLVPGTYTVCFADFQGQKTTSDPDGFAQTCLGATATQRSAPVTVASGQTTDGSVTMPGLRRISGQVTDADGHPLQGVDVQADASNGEFRDATTDVDGYYVIKGLNPGAYTVCFLGDGADTSSTTYGNQCWDHVAPGGTPTTITVDGSTDFANVDATLPATAAQGDPAAREAAHGRR